MMRFPAASRVKLPTLSLGPSEEDKRIAAEIIARVNARREQKGSR